MRKWFESAMALSGLVMIGAYWVICFALVVSVPVAVIWGLFSLLSVYP